MVCKQNLVLVRCDTIWKKVDRKVFFPECNRKKYRTCFRQLERNIATDTAKISPKNHVFQAFLSEFQVKCRLKSPDMSNLSDNTYHVREIDVFCATDVFYGDFVSSGCTRVQNRVHGKKKWRRTLLFCRNTSIFAVFFWKTHTISHGIPHIALTYRTSTVIRQQNVFLHEVKTTPLLLKVDGNSTQSGFKD